MNGFSCQITLPCLKIHSQDNLVYMRYICEYIAFTQKIIVISEEVGTFLYDTGYTCIS